MEGVEGGHLLGSVAIEGADYLEVESPALTQHGRLEIRGPGRSSEPQCVPV